MISNYIDIKLEQSDKTPHFVNKLFTRIHGFISDNKLNNIAVYFPEIHSRGLGSTVRVFSDKQTLKLLIENPGVLYFSKAELANFSDILDTPDSAKQAVLKRDRLIEAGKRPNKDVPYVVYQNDKNGKTFSIFLRREIVDDKTEGDFSSFGLSRNGATVPVF